MFHFLKLDRFQTYRSYNRGGSRIFFRRGCTRLLLYFNTNKPHSFCRIPVVLENRRSSRGGGVRTPCTLPLDPPLYNVLFKLPYIKEKLNLLTNCLNFSRSLLQIFHVFVCNFSRDFNLQKSVQKISKSGSRSSSKCNALNFFQQNPQE